MVSKAVKNVAAIAVTFVIFAITLFIVMLAVEHGIHVVKHQNDGENNKGLLNKGRNRFQNFYFILESENDLNCDLS